MDLEQLEFAISRYLESDLPDAESRALELRLESDESARALLAEHRKLTEMLRALPGPEVEGVAAWGELAGDFSAVITGTVDEQAHAQDQKLNVILQSAGATPEVAWEALAHHISARLDVELVATDESDEQLDSMLRAAPIPNVNWNGLAGRISDEIARAAQVKEAEDRAAEQSRRGRVFSIGWKNFGRLAVAAVVVIAATIGFRAMMNQSGSETGPGAVAVGPGKGTTAMAVAIVVGPQEEKAAGPAVSEISIGPAPSFASAQNDEEYASSSSRSPVVIAMPVRLAEDTSPLGFE